MKYTTEMIHDAFSFLTARDLGFEPKSQLLELSIHPGSAVMLSWLSQPYIEFGDTTYSLDKALEKLLKCKAKETNMVLDILQGWFEQFCRLADDKVKGGWAINHDALNVIWYAIQHGEEYNVYVPMFDINFTNEPGDNGEGEELWAPVQAFSDFIDVASSCYELLEDANKCSADYTMKMDDKQVVVANEASADIDKEFTDDERKQAIERLEKVRATLQRAKSMQEDRVQAELSAKMAAKNAMRREDKLVATLPDGPDKAATRKLKDCLRALKKYRPEKHMLDVDGWVVRLTKVSNKVYMIQLPWVPGELTPGGFTDYVTAKKDKKCPVAWEYLYIIDKFLQAL